MERRADGRRVAVVVRGRVRQRVVVMVVGVMAVPEVSLETGVGVLWVRPRMLSRLNWFVRN